MTPSAQQLANALRFLAIDAVQQANSGHPGAPMGMADIAEVLWRRHLKHNPANPQWPDRDRFVLSNGHASMLLYGLLHLSGYALPLDNAVETQAAWLAAVECASGPSCLVLSHQPREAQQMADIRKGGYVLAGGTAPPAVVLLATGSEVQRVTAARAQLLALGIEARVVSMPCTSEFDRQSPAYRQAVLPRGVPVLAVEAGVTNFWRQYTGFEGDVIGIDRFGDSAPAAQVYAALGITVEAVVARARSLAGPAVAHSAEPECATAAR